MFARALYGALLWLALPLVWLRLYQRGRAQPAYRRRKAERFGVVPADVPERPIWFHTVSAGETIAAAPMIRALVRQFASVPFLVTTMTPTGSAEVDRLLRGQVAHCYAPYDFGFAVRRFLNQVRPRMLVLMETELWPNLIAECARLNIPVFVVNARMSARSARGYRRIRWLTRPMLGRLSWVAVQYSDHAARFIGLGLPPDRIEVCGSVKFDASLPADHQARVAALGDRWRVGGRFAWIAASTHPGEDEVVLAAHRLLLAARPDALLILVPRHPERFHAVERLAAEAGFSVGRLSAASTRTSGERRGGDVLIGDTMGELLYLYGLAQVAFIGGSLVPHGGHNPVEPALLGVPMLMGPHRFNFADVVQRFVEAGCLHETESAEALFAQLTALMTEPERRATEGEAARQVVAENRGATARILQRLEREIGALAD